MRSFIVELYSKIEARTVPLPKHIHKAIEDWAIPQSLYFFLKNNKAKDSLYKKYKVPRSKETGNRVNYFKIAPSDLKVGTLKSDEISLWVVVHNTEAREKGAYGVFSPEYGEHKVPVIRLFQPWKENYSEVTDDSVNEFIKDMKTTIEHELMHFIQWMTKENVGGKPDQDDNYWLKSHEYKPQLSSAVRRFEKELSLLDKHKAKPHRKHLEEFVGIRLRKPKNFTMLGEMNTDDLFFNLKKHKYPLWKKAVKDFLRLLATSPTFRYKALVLDPK